LQHGQSEMTVFYQYSDAGLALTKRFEGLRLVAYQDSKGVWTIGYGHTKDVKKGDTCTREQAEKWLFEDAQSVVAAINATCVPLSQNQFDALVDFAFNLGVTALFNSTLWRKVKIGDIIGASEQFARWNNITIYVNGSKVLKQIDGLTKRREAERILFLSR